jgi:hypothetical protein
MGEAASRKVAEAAWLTSLGEQERSVVHAAKALSKALPLDGACYRAALFLKLFLEHEHAINGEAVIGFVNDGTDDLYMSHAWFEFHGQRTDLTLCRPLHPDMQKPGSLVIQGRVVVKGWKSYTYHQQRPREGVSLINKMMSNPTTRQMLIKQKDLHLRMSTTAQNNALIKLYLDGAPDGISYDAIAERVRLG